jgi:hypothetical protein
MFVPGIGGKLRHKWIPLGIFWAALSVQPSELRAQDINYRPVTIGFGGSATPAIDQGYRGGWDLMGSGGFGVTQWSHHRKWRLYFNGNFLFEHLGVTQQALKQSLPSPSTTTTTGTTSTGTAQTPTAAKARFYSATFDPTFRYVINTRWSWYALGGFGWLERSIDFTGAANQGDLLQPAAPSLLKPSANSGAVDAGGGVNVLLGGQGSAMLFMEARYLRGLGGNRGAAIVPLAVGFRW